MRRLLPAPAEPADALPVDLANEYAYPAAARWMRANFVTTVDGAIRGPDGLSGSISGRADKRVFSALRKLADCLLVGAETVRAEDYSPATLPIAIVSGRLELDLSRPLFATPIHRPMVLTTEAAPPDQVRAVAEVADVLVCGEQRVDLVVAVSRLVELGYSRLLCEGGPSLLAQLLGAGLLDELCLTVSPVLAGAGPQLLPHPLESTRGLVPAGLLEDDGFLFHRYLVRP